MGFIIWNTGGDVTTVVSVSSDNRVNVMCSGLKRVKGGGGLERQDRVKVPLGFPRSGK